MKNLILVFTVLFSLNLFASDEHGEGPCKADREKLCPGIEKGEGRIRKCMHDNMDKVSAECEKYL